MSDFTIFHSPTCSKSLAVIGRPPENVEQLLG